MKLAITLPAALLATTAMADMSETGHIRATEILQNPVYTTAGYKDDWNWDSDYETNDIAAFAQIGEIEDILMDRSGQVVGIVAEVGGFLDMGDKHVMLPVEDLRLVESADEYYYVTQMSEEQLEQRQSVDVSWMN